MSENDFFEREQQHELQKQQSESQYAGWRHEEQSAQNDCPACSAANEMGALYCQECGAVLAKETRCPQCGAKTQPQGDICEKCGTWLLTNKCKFCYAELLPDDKFCPECGNPAEGILCSNCGTLSFFDFCSKCNQPLTEFAAAELQKVQADPGLVQIQLLSAEIAREEAQVNELEKVDLKALEEQAKMEAEFEERKTSISSIKEYMRKVDEQSGKTTAPQKAAPSPQKKVDQGMAMRQALEKAKEAARLKNEIARKKREAAEKLSGCDSLQFPDPQQARRFFKATKPSVPCSWQCNYANVIHPDPTDCARPDLGGKWIVDLMKE